MQKTGAFGRRITVPHLVIQTPDGETVRVTAVTTGHATVLDQPVSLAELRLAPVPEATPETPEASTVPTGTTVTGDVYQRATGFSPGAEPATTSESAAPAAQSPAATQLDPALAYQLHAGPASVSTSRDLA
ncbi:hypothetical protein [Citricoccus nitrophenolicus]|uniref:hypothetical protein n=1 Tax=Citricoccus nitrophenolicus TaxID=863575 RepID=UPI0031ECEE19